LASDIIHAGATGAAASAGGPQHRPIGIARIERWGVYQGQLGLPSSAVGVGRKAKDCAVYNNMKRVSPAQSRSQGLLEARNEWRLIFLSAFFRKT
jgi:hypothetical protein